MVTVVAALITAAAALVIGLQRESVAVVRTGDLVAKYKGMEDARHAFEAQQKEWKGSVDTLEADYRKTVSDLNAEWSRLSAAEQEKRQELAETQQQNLLRYTEGLKMEAGRQQQELVDQVLSRVNEAVRNYAQEEGYDVILGATSDGSVLYSEKYLDITDELIDVLNREYEMTKSSKGSVEQ